MLTTVHWFKNDVSDDYFKLILKFNQYEKCTECQLLELQKRNPIIYLLFSFYLQFWSLRVINSFWTGPDSVIGKDGEYPLAKVVLGSEHATVKLTYSGMLE